MVAASCSASSQASPQTSDADLGQVPSVKQVSKGWIKKTALCKAWHDSKNEAKASALQSWKALILSSGRSTALGASIMADMEAAGGQKSEELVFQSVRDAFAGKSVSTLRSRQKPTIGGSQKPTIGGVDFGPPLTPLTLCCAMPALKPP